MEKITKSSKSILIDPNEPLILPDGTALVGRIEWFLYALCCLDYQNLPTPMSRIEEFANALITGEIPNIEPQSRAEQFFLAILDGNVSNLPQPQSRSEVLLDKLARGEFDLSDVEPIQSRYELLLAYLIKNGGIGNIDYVLYEFSEAMKTMYNTVEKPFKSLELSGNTLVNCVLEDTENDDYTSFDKDYSGTSFTINGTSEGAIKSAILKGNTLVNCIIDSSKNGYGATNNNIKFGSDGWITATATNNNNHFEMKMSNLNIKPSTKYLFVFECESNSFEGSTNNLMLGNTYSSVVDSPWDGQLVIPFLPVGISTYTMTTKSDFLTLNNPIGCRSFISVGTGVTKFRYMVIEYQQGMENWDIPYFTGMQSVKLPVLTTAGKNLFNGNLTKGGATTSVGRPYEECFSSISNIRAYSELIKTNGNSIAISLSDSTKKYALYQYDDNKCYISGSVWSSNQTQVITLNSNTMFVNIYVGNSDDSDITDNLTDFKKSIQIEEGSIATSYEPYKTNILSTPEEVVLRSLPNGVCDTLNVETGEYVQRIGEVVKNNATGFSLSSGGWENKTRVCTFEHFRPEGMKVQEAKDKPTLNCDKVPSNTFTAQWKNSEGIESITQHSGGNIILSIVRDKLLTQDIDGLNTYLQSNPLTIQYELETPIVKTVDLNVVDQNNTKIDKMHVFNETTHVNASSDELTPTVNIGKSVSYPTIIKPSTKYTVDLKRNDKPLTVNLGGTEVTFTSGETRKTITTPSTLTNDKLSYYGVGAKCNEIMLIEGEAEGNVDYFTGMQSVVMQNQMPILCTTGKNLLNPSWKKEYGKFYPFKLKKGTTLTLSTKDSVPSLGGNILFTDVKGNEKWFSIDAGATKNTITLYEDVYQVNNVLSGTIEYQLEIGSVATAYEPYKSSILSCNDDVTLRGIGDIKDELNLLTGELTERIGEIVLDGSENWIKPSSQPTNTARFLLTDFPNNRDTKIKSNFKVKKNAMDDEIGIWCDVNTVLNLDTSVDTVDSLKVFLSKNPIKLQYSLATESVKAVDLDVVDQDGNTIPKIKSYNDVTHLEVSVPKQSLLPHISAEVATDNSKDMSSLTIKHQEISETQSAIQDNIQSQSDEIDTALMATTEIFESILE